MSLLTLRRYAAQLTLLRRPHAAAVPSDHRNAAGYDFYKTNLFCAEFHVKFDGHLIKKVFLTPQNGFLCTLVKGLRETKLCRRSRRNAAGKLIYVPINFYYEGTLLVQRASLGDQPL